MRTISIILVTHNSIDYVDFCLGSIFSQEFEDYEIIIIDNASHDQTKSLIKAKYPGVILIENADNFGPCRARNQGIAKAEGNFVLFLDHDVKIPEDFLINMHKTIISQDHIAAVGPKILMADAKTIYSTGVFPSYLWRFYDIDSGKEDVRGSESNRYVFGISTAAALYRKEALDSIRQGREYFDEDFFYLFEDVDLCWRVQKKGWKILYTPNVSCLHKSGRSRNRDKISQYLSMRNRYLLLIKNESLFNLLRFFIVFFIYDLWRNLFMLGTNTKYFFKASFEVIKISPRMLKKRKL